VRATLHDELMREAGFESDYYAEHARRREQRRLKLRADLLRATRAAAVVAVLFGAAVWFVDAFGASVGVARAPLRVGEVALVVGLAADFLLDRMRGEGEPSGLLRRVFWRCGRVVVWAGRRVAHRRETKA